MGFVGGLMGPYMRPIPVGASSAMLVSMLVAFVITPWAAYRILRGPARRDAVDSGAPAGEHAGREGFTTRLYRRVMARLVGSRLWRISFLAGTVALLLGTCALVPLGVVTVKMLPFDNKSELQVVIDMPEGTPLEKSANAALEIAALVRPESEVSDIEVHAGTAGPYNFNGLVRHYFLRRGPTVADLQVNLAGKHERAAQSHDFAKRVRPRLEEAARRLGTRIKLAEVPPGPPVLQTIVAEVYGPDREERLRLAAQVKAIFECTEGVSDVDWHIEDDQPKEILAVDEAKASR